MDAQTRILCDGKYFRAQGRPNRLHCFVDLDVMGWLVNTREVCDNRASAERRAAKFMAEKGPERNWKRCSAEEPPLDEQPPYACQNCGLVGERVGGERLDLVYFTDMNSESLQLWVCPRCYEKVPHGHLRAVAKRRKEKTNGD